MATIMAAIKKQTSNVCNQFSLIIPKEMITYIIIHQVKNIHSKSCIQVIFILGAWSYGRWGEIIEELLNHRRKLCYAMIWSITSSYKCVVLERISIVILIMKNNLNLVIIGITNKDHVLHHQSKSVHDVTWICPEYPSNCLSRPWYQDVLLTCLWGKTPHLHSMTHTNHKIPGFIKQIKF